MRIKNVAAKYRLRRLDSLPLQTVPLDDRLSHDHRWYTFGTLRQHSQWCQTVDVSQISSIHQIILTHNNGHRLPGRIAVALRKARSLHGRQHPRNASILCRQADECAATGCNRRLIDLPASGARWMIAVSPGVRYMQDLVSGSATEWMI